MDEFFDFPEQSAWEQDYLQGLASVGDPFVAKLVNMKDDAAESALTRIYQQQRADAQAAWNERRFSPPEEAERPHTDPFGRTDDDPLGGYYRNVINPALNAGPDPSDRFAGIGAPGVGDDFMERSLASHYARNVSGSDPRFTGILDDISSPSYQQVARGTLGRGGRFDYVEMGRAVSLADDIAMPSGSGLGWGGMAGGGGGFSGGGPPGSGPNDPFGPEDVPGQAAPDSPFARMGQRGLTNFQESLRGYGAINYGYAAMQLGEGAGHYYDATQSGNYLTPEQQQAAQAGMLPGVLGAIGTVAGAAFGGPMGAWAGGLVGGGIGSVTEGAIGANDQRDQATREAAEKLAAALGETASSVASFRTQIEQTGSPIATFSSVLNAAGGVGNYGAGTVSGVGRLANALGEYAEADAPVIARYAGNPASYGIGARFAGGTLSGGDLDTLGFDAAISGDFAGLKTLQHDAALEHVSDTPAFQAAARQSVDNRPWWEKALGINSNSAAMGAATMDYLRQNPPPDAAAAAQNQIADQFAQIRALDVQLIPQAANAQSALQMATIRGGSVSDVAGATGAYQGALAGLSGLNSQRIQALQSYLRTNPGDAQAQQQLTEALGQSAQYGVQSAQVGKASFEYGLDAETSGFDLSLSRSEYSGQSAADTRYQVDTQARYLGQVASDPRNPLSPSERNQVESMRLDLTRANDSQFVGDTEAQFNLSQTEARYGGATAQQMAGAVAGEAGTLRGLAADGSRLYTLQERDTMRGAADDMVHQNMMADIQQKVSGADIFAQRSEHQYQLSALTDSPEAAYAAAADRVKELTGEFDRLTDALKRHGLTVEESQGLTRSRDSISANIALDRVQDRRAEYEGREHIADNRMASAMAGLDRNLRVYGDAGVDTAGITADYRQTQGLLQQSLAAEKPGSQRASDIQREIDERAAQFNSLADTLHQYHPDAATQEGLINAQGAVYRMSQGFAEPGDLNAARGGELSALDKMIAGTDANRQRHIAAGDWSPADQLGYAQQHNDELNQRADLRGAMFHDMIDRLPMLTEGGVSREMLYLPSDADAARSLEQDARKYNMPFLQGVSAAHFGFLSPGAFDMVSASWDGMGTAGKTWADVQPGNQSLAALAGARHFSFGGTAAPDAAHPPLPFGPSGPAALSHGQVSLAPGTVVSLAPGTTINVEIRMPDGTRQNHVGTIQTTAARQAGMGAIPGIGK